MTLRSRWPGVLLASVILALAGCNLVPERTPIALYDLPARPLEPAPGDSPRIELTLRLATPRADGLLEGSRIVVVPQPNRPQVYEGVRWSDGVPLLLRDRLIDAFHDDGRVLHLVPARSGVSADVELLTDLLRFRSEYREGHPEAEVRLDARLVDASTGELIASQRFSQRHVADSEAVGDVVEAFGLATDRLASELVDWSADQLQQR
ncbi:ABC-type transport auxiliary lipoprotein family protein [Billgrantia sp. LNSP4103-1]|uniref:ABC-type transport auxiliary lipoprotein family protein n=1 Tax=Billgrantia sp. LNSP4103-1 TaxID=3410266 RepID=UPI00403F508A